MTCADLEILLADYVDGTLRGEEKSALESHLAGCAECAELARDASGAVAFMERAATVERRRTGHAHSVRDHRRRQPRRREAFLDAADVRTLARAALCSRASPWAWR